jgi:hypothetical protein
MGAGRRPLEREGRECEARRGRKGLVEMRECWRALFRLFANQEIILYCFSTFFDRPILYSFFVLWNSFLINLEYNYFKKENISFFLYINL